MKYVAQEHKKLSIASKFYLVSENKELSFMIYLHT